MTAVSADSPSIALELKATLPPAGDVVLTNETDRAIRLWRTGNQWGDGNLSFLVARGERSATIERVPQDYTRNVPSSYELPAHGSERLAFDLGDGSWQPADVLATLGAGARLAAVLEIEPTPESSEHGVWTGRVRSEPVELG